MSVTMNPYLSFSDNAREAMTFYQEVFGGDLVISTFGEYGDKDAPEADLVMHGQLDTPDGMVLMGADSPPGMGGFSPAQGMTVSVFGDDNDRLRGWFAKLADGGEVSVPLEKQVWGDEFGQCKDRFGTPWMFNLANEEGSS